MQQEPSRPLADRIRPRTLSEYIGQQHLVGTGKPIRRIIEQRKPFSMILWGPPGVGKTTLAKLIAEGTGSAFTELSAVSAGKADVKRIVEEAIARRLPVQQEIPADRRQLRLRGAPQAQHHLEDGENSDKTILFLDEIHRFNKAQQDFLLPYVENGTLILIGATTENPSFEVIPPLLSRCQVFVV